MNGYWKEKNLHNKTFLWYFYGCNGLFQKKIVPVEDIDFFEVDPLDFQSNLPWLPWNFLFFCIDPPGKSIFFSSIFGVPPGIPTTFTLLPGIFHWYPQQGGYRFFLKSPILFSTARKFKLFGKLRFHPLPRFNQPFSG